MMDNAVIEERLRHTFDAMGRRAVTKDEQCDVSEGCEHQTVETHDVRARARAP
jgi:hypothetical protein